MKTIVMMITVALLIGCGRSPVEQSPHAKPTGPSSVAVQAAVIAAAIQKGIIVTSVEKAPGDLAYVCKGELKTKAIPVSDTLVLKVSEAGQWQGNIKFDLDEPIKVIVKERE